jgi:hypothetical protein
VGGAVAVVFTTRETPIARRHSQFPTRHDDRVAFGLGFLSRRGRPS